MERILLCMPLMVAVEPGLTHSALQSTAAPARFERLFVTHYPWVWRTLRRLGVHPGAVDDAAQYVFLTASQRLNQIPVEKERAFLMGVVARTASNARRTELRRRETPNTDEDGVSGYSVSPEELLDWKQRREKLDEWLAALSLTLRAPFILFELEGLSLLEICEVLELPLGTVKTRLRRARAIFLEVAGTGGAP